MRDPKFDQTFSGGADSDADEAVLSLLNLLGDARFHLANRQKRDQLDIDEHYYSGRAELASPRESEIPVLGIQWTSDGQAVVKFYANGQSIAEDQFETKMVFKWDEKTSSETREVFKKGSASPDLVTKVIRTGDELRVESTTDRENQSAVFQNGVPVDLWLTVGPSKRAIRFNFDTDGTVADIDYSRTTIHIDDPTPFKVGAELALKTIAETFGLPVPPTPHLDERDVVFQATGEDVMEDTELDVSIGTQLCPGTGGDTAAGDRSNPSLAVPAVSADSVLPLETHSLIGAAIDPVPGGSGLGEPLVDAALPTEAQSADSLIGGKLSPGSGGDTAAGDRGEPLAGVPPSSGAMDFSIGTKVSSDKQDDTAYGGDAQVEAPGVNLQTTGLEQNTVMSTLLPLDSQNSDSIANAALIDTPELPPVPAYELAAAPGAQLQLVNDSGFVYGGSLDSVFVEEIVPGQENVPMEPSSAGFRELLPNAGVFVSHDVTAGKTTLVTVHPTFGVVQQSVDNAGVVTTRFERGPITSVIYNPAGKPPYVVLPADQTEKFNPAEMAVAVSADDKIKVFADGHIELTLTPPIPEDVVNSQNSLKFTKLFLRPAPDGTFKIVGGQIEQDGNTYNYSDCSDPVDRGKQLYKQVFNRDIEPDNTWPAEHFRNKGTYEGAVRAILANSLQEFKKSIPSNKDEIMPFLFQRLLNRKYDPNGDPANDKKFRELLDQGKIDEVIEIILKSKEFQSQHREAFLANLTDDKTNIPIDIRVVDGRTIKTFLNGKVIEEYKVNGHTVTVEANPNGKIITKFSDPNAPFAQCEYDTRLKTYAFCKIPPEILLRASVDGNTGELKFDPPEKKLADMKTAEYSLGGVKTTLYWDGRREITYDSAYAPDSKVKEIRYPVGDPRGTQIERKNGDVEVGRLNAQGQLVVEVTCKTPGADGVQKTTNIYADASGKILLRSLCSGTDGQGSFQRETWQGTPEQGLITQTAYANGSVVTTIQHGRIATVTYLPGSPPGATYAGRDNQILNDVKPEELVIRERLVQGKKQQTRADGTVVTELAPGVTQLQFKFPLLDPQQRVLQIIDQNTGITETRFKGGDIEYSGTLTADQLKKRGYNVADDPNIGKITRLIRRKNGEVTVEYDSSKLEEPYKDLKSRTVFPNQSDGARQRLDYDGTKGRISETAIFKNNEQIYVEGEAKEGDGQYKYRRFNDENGNAVDQRFYADGAVRIVFHDPETKFIYVETRPGKSGQPEYWALLPGEENPRQISPGEAVFPVAEIKNPNKPPSKIMSNGDIVTTFVPPDTSVLTEFAPNDPLQRISQHVRPVSGTIEIRHKDGSVETIYTKPDAIIKREIWFPHNDPAGRVYVREFVPGAQGDIVRETQFKGQNNLVIIHKELNGVSGCTYERITRGPNGVSVERDGYDDKGHFIERTDNGRVERRWDNGEFRVQGVNDIKGEILAGGKAEHFDLDGSKGIVETDEKTGQVLSVRYTDGPRKGMSFSFRYAEGKVVAVTVASEATKPPSLITLTREKEGHWNPAGAQVPGLTFPADKIKGDFTVRPNGDIVFDAGDGKKQMLSIDGSKKSTDLNTYTRIVEKNGETKQECWDGYAWRQATSVKTENGVTTMVFEGSPSKIIRNANTDTLTVEFPPPDAKTVVCAWKEQKMTWKEEGKPEKIYYNTGENGGDGKALWYEGDVVRTTATGVVVQLKGSPKDLPMQVEIALRDSAPGVSDAGGTRSRYPNGTVVARGRDGRIVEITNVNGAAFKFERNSTGDIVAFTASDGTRYTRRGDKSGDSPAQVSKWNVEKKGQPSAVLEGEPKLDNKGGFELLSPVGDGVIVAPGGRVIHRKDGQIVAVTDVNGQNWFAAGPPDQNGEQTFTIMHGGEQNTVKGCARILGNGSFGVQTGDGIIAPNLADRSVSKFNEQGFEIQRTFENGVQIIRDDQGRVISTKDVDGTSRDFKWETPENSEPYISEVLINGKVVEKAIPTQQGPMLRALKDGADPNQLTNEHLGDVVIYEPNMRRTAIHVQDGRSVGRTITDLHGTKRVENGSQISSIERGPADKSERKIENDRLVSTTDVTGTLVRTFEYGDPQNPLPTTIVETKNGGEPVKFVLDKATGKYTLANQTNTGEKISLDRVSGDITYEREEAGSPIKIFTRVETARGETILKGIPGPADVISITQTIGGKTKKVVSADGDQIFSYNKSGEFVGAYLSVSGPPPQLVPIAEIDATGRLRAVKNANAKEPADRYEDGECSYDKSTGSMVIRRTDVSGHNIGLLEICRDGTRVHRDAGDLVVRKDYPGGRFERYENGKLVYEEVPNQYVKTYKDGKLTAHVFAVGNPVKHEDKDAVVSELLPDGSANIYHNGRQTGIQFADKTLLIFGANKGELAGLVSFHNGQSPLMEYQFEWQGEGANRKIARVRMRKAYDESAKWEDAELLGLDGFLHPVNPEPADKPAKDRLRPEIIDYPKNYKGEQNGTRRIITSGTAQDPIDWWETRLDGTTERFLGKTKQVEVIRPQPEAPAKPSNWPATWPAGYSFKSDYDRARDNALQSAVSIQGEYMPDGRYRLIRYLSKNNGDVLTSERTVETYDPGTGKLTTEVYGQDGKLVPPPTVLDTSSIPNFRKEYFYNLVERNQPEVYGWQNPDGSYAFRDVFSDGRVRLLTMDKDLKTIVCTYFDKDGKPLGEPTKYPVSEKDAQWYQGLAERLSSTRGVSVFETDPERIKIYSRHGDGTWHVDSFDPATKMKVTTWYSKTGKEVGPPKETKLSEYAAEEFLKDANRTKLVDLEHVSEDVDRCECVAWGQVQVRRQLPDGKSVTVTLAQPPGELPFGCVNRHTPDGKYQVLTKLADGGWCEHTLGADGVMRSQVFDKSGKEVGAPAELQLKKEDAMALQNAIFKQQECEGRILPDGRMQLLASYPDGTMRIDTIVPGKGMESVIYGRDGKPLSTTFLPMEEGDEKKFALYIKSKTGSNIDYENRRQVSPQPEVRILPDGKFEEFVTYADGSSLSRVYDPVSRTLTETFQEKGKEAVCRTKQLDDNEAWAFKREVSRWQPSPYVVTLPDGTMQQIFEYSNGTRRIYSFDPKRDLYTESFVDKDGKDLVPPVSRVGDLQTGDLSPAKRTEATKLSAEIAAWNKSPLHPELELRIQEFLRDAKRQGCQLTTVRLINDELASKGYRLNVTPGKYGVEYSLRLDRITDK